jgi:hypothetical protein
MSGVERRTRKVTEPQDPTAFARRSRARVVLTLDRASTDHLR